MAYKDLFDELANRLKISVEKNNYDGLLFSGGLDTSILLYLNQNVIAVTVSLGDNAKDLPYAIFLTKLFNIKHYHKKVAIDEAIENIPHLIRILKSFDPAIPNDLVVYFGLKTAKELGLRKVATGDGSDELFAGYSYMEKIENLEEYIQKISRNMNFSSNKIGKFFGIKIIQPFMDKEFIEFALKIPVNLKIKRQKGKMWGKWILRKAFEDFLPKKIIWQEKRPLEYGSGMTKIRKIISRKISNHEFKRKQEIYPVKFISKEHMYYYEIYKKVIGKIPKPKASQVKCFGCGAGIYNWQSHCRVCGWVKKY